MRLCSHNPLKRNLGQFRISKELIDTCYHEVKQLLSQCLIIQADYDPCSDAITYLAYSDAFAEAPKGYLAPWYEPVITREPIPGLRSMKITITGFTPVAD